MTDKPASDKNKEDKNAFNPNAAAAASGADGMADDGATDSPATKLEEMKALADKNMNDFLYLRADFENYKKNAIKERSEYLKYGSERLIVDVLGVLDNFERALDTKITPESLPTFVKGIEMTATELRAVLNKFGVQEIPSIGKAFDPNIHEALSSEESASIEPGHITRVFKKPYKLHEKVVRPGQVVVAKQASN